MSLAVIGWLFTLGVLAHNTEEALHLPAWSAHASNWYPSVGERAFRFAAIALSVLFVLTTATASFSQAGSVAAYLMAGYVLAMVLNVLMPHVLVTVLTRKYMPGTATAILLNLPLGLLYLQKVLSENHIQLHVFYWAGPLVVLSILALLPALLALGRKLYPGTA
jgi:Protein of unknown function with HXXEE motif